MAAKVKSEKSNVEANLLSDTNPPLELTKQAIAQVREAIKREQQPKGTGLRVLLVQVANGYRYDLQFDSKEMSGDHVSLQGGLKVFIDPIVASALGGMRIDYQAFPGVEWGGFLFEKVE